MSVMLLHDLGDAAGGGRWRAAAPAEWNIPDLPGHGTAPALRTGHYDPMAVVAIARWTVGPSSTLVGVRRNAHAALVHAAGGGCARVVVVDGLWGPWRTPEHEIDAMYSTIRAIAEDPLATAPAPSSGLDPRARYGYGLTVSAHFAEQFWGAIAVPVLAVETPASATPPSEREARLSWFGGAAELAAVDDDEPRTIVAVIHDWMGRAP